MLINLQGAEYNIEKKRSDWPKTTKISMFTLPLVRVKGDKKKSSMWQRINFLLIRKTLTAFLSDTTLTTYVKTQHPSLL